jgi:predicted Rossmann fold nucleotide-binding protein DprA/Smf involved in DNA uptake
MALGIDAACAVGALAAKGCTVAVLGCGIDVVYPKQHDRLMHAIAEHGLVLTEFPPATPPRGYHFPIRNRIISGLGAGTLVVEADLGSGALITAREAIVQGKDIYAVPGNVGDQNTSGTNALIRDGAAVALGARDILQNYAFLYRDSVDTARLMRAQERSDPDPAVFARYGVGLPAASAPVKSVSEVRAEQKQTQKQSAPKAEKPERTQPDKTDAAKEQPAKEQHVDHSAEVLAQFSDRQREMFAQIPLDKAISADWLVRCGYPAHEVMMALTMFEIKGLISSLPGGLYTRK